MKKQMKTIIKSNCIIIAITISFILISCNENEKLVNSISRMKSCPIDLCLDSLQYYVPMTKCLTEDDSLSFYQENISLVVYTDSSVCSSCTVNGMYKWVDFLEEIENCYSDRLKIYFIFSPRKSQMNDFRNAIHSLNLNYPIFIDTTNIFVRQNPHIPNNIKLHTFLINSDKMVCLVGSPLDSPTILELFHKIASGLIQMECENKPYLCK